ncbi:MAG TPA: MnhB domain-containing protein [Solirubrobacteraceae bacterium]|nr:MnhB domain-containing protein [Solirubrobacteraceae bacterium]
MTSVLTQMVARALLAPSLIVAAAILVKGYTDVGDGFAAGIVAALGVLLQFLAFGRDEVVATLPVERAPVVALSGLALAVAVFAAPLLAGAAPLEHWPPAGEEPVHVGSLELISAVVFDVGVFLLVLGSAVAIIAVIAALAEDHQ